MIRRVLLLSTLAVLAFAPFLPLPYQYDDVVVVRDNTLLQTNQGLKEVWKGHVDPAGLMDGSYRPIFLSALSFVGRATNFSPEGLRVLSILLHIANGALLLLLLHRTFSLGLAASTVVTALFLLHPIQVTGIGMVWKQSDLWIAFFLLSSVAVIVEAARRERRALVWIALVCQVLAFGVKESAIIFPLFWIALEPVLPEKGRPLRLLIAAEGIILSAGYYFLLWPSVPRREDFYGSIPATRWQYFLTQLHVAPIYLKTLVWPSLLTIDRSIPLAPRPSFLGIGVIVSCLTAVAVLIGISLRRNLPALVLLCFAGIWLIPTSTLQPLSLVYDETRLYLTLAFGAAFLALVLKRFLRGVELRKSVGSFAFVGLALALVGSTWAQFPRWKSEEALWESAIATDPRSARAYYQLALLAEDQRALDDAEKYYRQTLEVNSAMIDARLNLGIVMGRKGDLDGAAEQFRLMLREAPRWAALGHYHLGLDAIYRKNFEGARSHFRASQELAPKSNAAEKGEAILLTEMGKKDEAIEAWRRYLKTQRTLSVNERKYAEKELAKLAALGTVR